MTLLDRTSRPRRRRVAAIKLDLTAALLGAVAFLVVIGANVLRLDQIAWLQGEDFSTYYLGWLSFGHSGWSSPISGNPRYGLEYASSILFSDSLPLFAIPAKLAGLPRLGTTQYFGWWILLCFVMQAISARRLLSLASDRIVAVFGGTALIVFAPPFLFRLGLHLSLSGHWLIILALYLNLLPAPRHPFRGWTILLLVALFTHPYLLIMCLALWLADVARRLSAPASGVGSARATWPKLALELLGVPVVLAVVTVATGLYTFPVVEAQPAAGSLTYVQGYGLGRYGANLLSPIDSDSWSYFWPDLPTWRFAAEDNGFYGVGSLGLLLAALAIAVRAPRRPDLRRYLPLGIAVVGMAVFAIGKNLMVGSWHLPLPWPSALVKIGTVLRGTERFDWPLFYLGEFVAFKIVARALGGRLLSVLMTILALAQAVDTSAGWLPLHRRMAVTGKVWRTPLVSPFWTEAAACYRVVRQIPAGNHQPDYFNIAYFALTHGMSTDAAYLARTSFPTDQLLAARFSAALRSGAWPPDTFYVVDERTARLAAAHAVAGEPSVMRIDGRFVVSPFWRKCRLGRQ